MSIIYLLEKRPCLSWTLTIFYAGIIFLFSSMPVPPQPVKGVGYAPFIEHIVEYSILGFLLLASLRGSERTRGRAIIIAILVATFYGITDEIHQAFVPGRDLSIMDVLADSIGAIIGVISINPGNSKSGPD